MIRQAITVAYIYLFILLLTPEDKVIDEINISYIQREPEKLKKYMRTLKLISNITNATYLPLNYIRPKRFRTDLKFILKYTKAFSHYNAPIFQDGQTPFISNNCSYYNCFITSEQNYLDDIRQFDAILFDVENYWDTHPIFRDKHQKYVLLATESADEYPICDPLFDNYYNWTWTYRLNSDIRWPFITITDKNGAFIGPKVNMNWIDNDVPAPKDVIKRLAKKKHAAAWFVSHCKARSGRDDIAANIVISLEKYNLTVDVYGWCGAKTCPRDDIAECLDMLERHYYFYFSFENALDEDYVTEKLLYAVQHYTVPVVYGGADYNRFLPPNSFINGAEDPDIVAAIMAKAIDDPETYHRYFRWHNYYEYEESPQDTKVCTLCEMLNESADKDAIVRNVRSWWQPKYSKRCNT